MTRSIHDNQVLGYEVDVRARMLVLRTEYREHGASERTDVVFTDVLGYHLFDKMGGILFSIEPIAIEQLVAEEAELLAKAEQYGGLFPWRVAELVERARATGATAYRIDSSIGFDGFVVCRSMAIVDR
jgi:hypothetical protein